MPKRLKLKNDRNPSRSKYGVVLSSHGTQMQVHMRLRSAGMGWTKDSTAERSFSVCVFGTKHIARLLVL